MSKTCSALRDTEMTSTEAAEHVTSTAEYRDEVADVSGDAELRADGVRRLRQRRGHKDIKALFRGRGHNDDGDVDVLDTLERRFD